MALIVVGPRVRAAALAAFHRPSHLVQIASPGAQSAEAEAACVLRDAAGRAAPQHDEVQGFHLQRHAEAARSAVSKHAPRFGPSECHPGGGRPASQVDHVLDLVFHDVAAPAPGLIEPSVADMAALLGFASGWDGTRPLLVCCALGISRSPAAALAIACARAPERDERDIAEALRAAAPEATPNPRLVALADDALGRAGRLAAAVAAIGRGADYVPQMGFILAVR